MICFHCSVAANLNNLGRNQPISAKGGLYLCFLKTAALKKSCIYKHVKDIIRWSSENVFRHDKKFL